MQPRQYVRRIDVQHVFAIWIAGLLKTGTEQEKVDRLADILDGLLAVPGAEDIQQRHEYESVRQRTRDLKPYGPGVASLGNVLIDLSWELSRRAIIRSPD